MLQGTGEELTRAISHAFSGEANHQLVIDLETARIKIRRANIDDPVDNDQLRVEDLGLIFIELDAFVQEPAIKTSSRQLGRHDIGFAREDQLHFPPATGDIDKLAPKAPGRDKIGNHDLNLL